MELLKRLYEVSSPSRDEKDMFKFIESWMEANGIPYAVHDWGITAVKGVSDTYPCVVAHMDEVHDRHLGKRIIETDGVLFGFDVATCEQCGIGADDKNGIWVALKMLEKLDAVKVAFFIGEEIGCIGSSQCGMEFFDDCRFVLQCDRRNGGDFITDAGVELCDKDFVEKCNIKQFGYKETDGLMTDVMMLKERGVKVACANLSCGYYNPHTAKEYTYFDELVNCLDFVEWICMNVNEVCYHEPKPRGRYGWTSWGDWYGYGDKYGDDPEFWETGGLGYENYGIGQDFDQYGTDEEAAYTFIYDELCYYDNAEIAPKFEDMLPWWREYTNGKGIGKKRFRRVYNQVVEDLFGTKKTKYNNKIYA